MNKLLLPLLVIAGAVSPALAQSTENAAEPAPTPAGKPRLELSPGTKCTAQMKFPDMERFLQSEFAKSQNYDPGPIQKKREVAFSGKDTSRFTTYTDGDTKLEFIRNGFYLSKGGNTGVQIQQLGTEGASGDFRGQHFPELGGMSKATYKGIAKIGQVEYYVYEAKHPDTGSDQKVYFSIDTLYPHHMTSAEQEVLYTYQDGVPLNQLFDLPEDLAARWKNVKEQTKRYYGRDIEKEGN